MLYFVDLLCISQISPFHLIPKHFCSIKQQQSVEIQPPARMISKYGIRFKKIHDPDWHCRAIKHLFLTGSVIRNEFNELAEA
jgi:hypothetical protein